MIVVFLVLIMDDGSIESDVGMKLSEGIGWKGLSFDNMLESKVIPSVVLSIAKIGKAASVSFIV